MCKIRLMMITQLLGGTERYYTYRRLKIFFLNKNFSCGIKWFTCRETKQAVLGPYAIYWILKPSLHVPSIESQNRGSWDRFEELTETTTCSKWDQNLILWGGFAPSFSEWPKWIWSVCSCQHFLLFLNSSMTWCLWSSQISTVVPQKYSNITVTSGSSYSTPRHFLLKCLCLCLHRTKCTKLLKLRISAGNSTDHRLDLLRSSNSNLPPSPCAPGRFS